jgi:ribulose-phosphate 3-epimerase
MVKISPSILSADFSNLEKELKFLEKSGADMIHIDVMDGAFVPNLTFGPPIIKSMRKHTSLPFDVHLMINNPENSIFDYVEAGADLITIHPETTTHLTRTIEKISQFGIKVGIALLPSSGVNCLEYIMDKIDLILVMSVNPGFGGQKFMPEQLNKINELSEKIKKSKRDILLSVDGGINDETAKKCIKAGANLLVSGSYIFTGDYEERINNLKHYSVLG